MEKRIRMDFSRTANEPQQPMLKASGPYLLLPVLQTDKQRGTAQSAIPLIFLSDRGNNDDGIIREFYPIESRSIGWEQQNCVYFFLYYKQRNGNVSASLP